MIGPTQTHGALSPLNSTSCGKLINVSDRRHNKTTSSSSILYLYVHIHSQLQPANSIHADDGSNSTTNKLFLTKT
ncbi:hypothetical protein QVD17_14717 [Tagetes erecta]|uniref:Uncharacterized protein n=1 Tax=Tagetes erecta TaxID=13708 RepID=A0AAD8NYY3_TARER|nr:hypothetical protein QVD17_14717 [Tagetes erecta]